MFPKNILQFVLTFIIGMLICLPIMYFTLNGLIEKKLGVTFYFTSTVILFIVIVHIINYKNNVKLIYNFKPFNIKFLLFLILIVWMLQTLIFIPLNNCFIFKQDYYFNWFYFFGAIIIAPIFEEIIFRNILLNSLLNKYNSKKSIIISACLFGLIHGNFFQIIFSTIMGLLFGMVYVKNKNIAYTIVLHFCNNMFVFIINFLIYKFLNTPFFNMVIVLNIIISFLLLQNFNKRYAFSIIKLVKQIQN